MGAIRQLQTMDDDELYVYAKELRAPIELIRQVRASRGVTCGGMSCLACSENYCCKLLLFCVVVGPMSDNCKTQYVVNSRCLCAQTKHLGRLPVVNFAAGGVATPADAALMMQMGMDGVFVGSGIFKSGDPAKRARAIVQVCPYFLLGLLCHTYL